MVFLEGHQEAEKGMSGGSSINSIHSLNCVTGLLCWLLPPARSVPWAQSSDGRFCANIGATLLLSTCRARTCRVLHGTLITFIHVCLQIYQNQRLHRILGGTRGVGEQWGRSLCSVFVTPRPVTEVNQFLSLCLPYL